MGLTDRLEVSVENGAENMEKSGENSARKQGFWARYGDLDQHHVLMGNGYTAIIEYNRMHLGVQAQRPVPPDAKKWKNTDGTVIWGYPC